MKQPRKIPGILIYLLILFFSVIGFVYALNSNVKEGYKQVVNLGGSKKTSDGVEVSKIIEETSLENYFDITLTVTTQTRVDEIITDQDLSIVVVMDISNTMKTNNIDGTSVKDNPNGTTRLEAAQEAANQFISDFASYSAETEAQRKIGFVVFNTDAHEVFELQDCKTEEDVAKLQKEVTTKTNAIVTGKDKYNTAYGSSYTRFTNIEAGLQRADDMLNSNKIKNKYIIFISDGYPTTYLNNETSDKYDGYNPYMSAYPDQNPDFDTRNKPTSSEDTGKFYNELTSELCIDGTSYSDWGAIRARKKATEIKSSGTKIYTIGIGINNQTVVPKISTYLVDVDKQTYESNNNNYELGSTTASFQNWLKSDIGSDYLIEPKSTEALKEAYADIFKKVKSYIEQSSQATWVAEDPMGVDGDVENIEFVGFIDEAEQLQDSLNINNENQSDTAVITNNKINWDLKNSVSTDTEINGITYYKYSIKYRVRIENELDSFSTEKIYDTNGVTKLTYVTRNNGILSENKEVEFPIPSVVAYLGEFSFTKKSASFDVIESGILAGAEFTLTHHKDCPCMVESDTNHIHMPETQSYKAVSGTDGKVTFTNIPSGHDYLLTETKAPDNYTASKTTKKINIAYGKVTGNPSNTEYENNIKTGDLKIAKTVEGNKDYSGEFEFKIVVKFDKTTLTGTYNYSLFDTSGKETTGELKLTDTFKLKDGEYIIIKDLPIDSTYEITELTTNGYTVKHTINSESRVTGKTATCSSNSCSIDSEDTQEVNFYNIAGYILPATGDSGMLILVIIASLLIIGPIIDIGYMFYKYRKEDKLTS